MALRARKANEFRAIADDERLQMLEESVKQAKFIAEERELMYEEVCLGGGHRGLHAPHDQASQSKC